MRKLIALGLLSSLLAVQAAHAASYNDEVSGLIRAGKSVKALGPDLFGDKVNYYTGSLEFVQPDVAIPGNNALPVNVARRLVPGWPARMRLGIFGDWDLEIPHLMGTFSNRNGWSTGGANGNKRCTNFDGPGSVVGTNNASVWDQEEFWKGNLLYVPGEGETELLVRTANTPAAPSDGYTYPLVTKQHWAFRCGTNLKSNAYFTATVNNQGEGFTGRSPDGTTWRFDWLVRREAENLYRASEIPTFARDTESTSASREGPTPNAATQAILGRNEVWILPTQSTDRFGNTVTYTYDTALPWRLSSIASSDGRTITLSYVGSTNRVSTVNDGTRTWTYGYGSSGELLSVTQPDSSQLTISGSDNFSITGSIAVDWGCIGTNSPGNSTGGVSMTISFMHPSGAQGSFTTQYTAHARSYVPQVCFGPDSVYARYPRYFSAKSLTTKQITGPGLPTQTWNYTYSSPNGQGSWDNCAGACPTTKTVTITTSDGVTKVLTYGTRHNVSDGKLLSTDESKPGYGLVRTTTQTYRTGREMGATVLDMGDGSTASVRVDPLQQREIVQQGQSFKWIGDTFDAFERVTSQRRIGPSGTRSETITLFDNTSVWVLGQQRLLTNSGGEVMSEREFHPTWATVTKVKEFGVVKEQITYNGDGTVASRADGLGNATLFSSYKRGLAQNVNYPDGNAESVAVNDLGWVTQHTDAAGYLTQFGYDNTWGQITSVTPPGGFTPTSFVFERVFGDEYGLPAGHWRHTSSQGNARTITYFDALWRPVMTRTFDNQKEASTRKVIVKAYDFNGKPSFESYPQRDMASVTDTSPGTRMQYDAISRVSQVQADSELGVLYTSTNYLSGFQTQTTNPRGKVTTQGFWSLDDPNSAQLASIAAPEGVSVAISRDIFGKPTAITRGGTSVNTNAGYTNSVTRRYVYDAGQRLCRTIEPEVGSTIQVYDAASNVVWKAPGQSVPDNGLCNEGYVADASKISYGYDQLSRLSTVGYGDGSPSIVRTYTLDGLLGTISHGGIVWTYGYNALRKPSTETLTYVGMSYGIGWGYNTQGDVNSLSYPASVALGYGVNALGEIESITGYASNITYHPNGAVAGYTLNNGIAHTLTQNTRGLPWVSTDAGIRQDYHTYDANGNVDGITDLQEGIYTRSLSYDDLDRLKGANAPYVWGSATYKYDTVDNLRSAIVGARSTSVDVNASNQVFNVSTNGVPMAYTFSNVGNLIAGRGQWFTYDLGNRMTVSSAGSYAYDGLGRRIQHNSNDLSTRYQVYSQAGQLLWGTSAGGPRPSSTTAYIYLGGKQIAETNSVSGTQFVHTDALGSPVAHTGPTGALINRSRFEPYGYVAAGTKPSADGSVIGFTGHVQDGETDLVYMQQRYYDPLIGRFLSVDPVVTDANVGKLFGRYAYVDNNPYGSIDPDGRLTNDQCRETPNCEVLIDAGRGHLSGDAGKKVSPSVSAASAPTAAAGSIVAPYPVATAPFAGATSWLSRLLSSTWTLPLLLTGDSARDNSLERVNRYVSAAEAIATRETGLARGGRDGTTFVTNDIYATATDAQRALALPVRPEVWLMLSVPKGAFSAASTVLPAYGQPGGGTERTGAGKIPVQVLGIVPLKAETK